MIRQPFVLQDPRIVEALQEMVSTTCLNTREIRTNLVGLRDYLEGAAREFATTEMDLLQRSNVSAERFLSAFLEAADRFFFSYFRRTRIPAAIQFVRVTQEYLGPGPAPATMPFSIYDCRNAFLILSRLREIERRFTAIGTLFNRMEPGYLADAQRIREVRGPSVEGAPEDDPGRGARPQSSAERIALGTVQVVRMEIDTMRRLVQGALEELVPRIGVVQAPRLPVRAILGL